jgi:hypothetical protein
VSDNEANPDFAYLDRVNENLAQSLRRCHALVDDCRDKLAANSNESEKDGESDDERVG